jgi:hypothetical protein
MQKMLRMLPDPLFQMSCNYTMAEPYTNSTFHYIKQVFRHEAAKKISKSCSCKIHNCNQSLRCENCLPPSIVTNDYGVRHDINHYQCMSNLLLALHSYSKVELVRRELFLVLKVKYV